VIKGRWPSIEEESVGIEIKGVPSRGYQASEMKFSAAFL